MRILVLDDDPKRIELFQEKFKGFDVTCTAHVKECIELLKKEDIFDHVFLDHDLDGKIYVPSGTGTGYEVAEWLLNNPDRKPKGKVIHHTLNEKAGPLMEKLLPGSTWVPGIFNMNINATIIERLEYGLKDKYARKNRDS